jgi:hypothetical protein
MSAVVSRERLAAVLGMLGSDHDGEVLSAARTAERLRQQAGVTWHDIVAPAAPQETTDDTTASDWRDLLDACCAYWPRLTAWERSFLDQLSRYTRAPTAKQILVLHGIARRVRT